VQRLESAATEQADQAPAKVVARQARTTSLALQKLITDHQSVPTSTSVAGLRTALAAAIVARERFDRLQSLLRQTTGGGEVDSTVMRELERVVRGWAAVNRGLLPNLTEYHELLPGKEEPVPSGEDLLNGMKRARAQYPVFAEQLRSRILALSTQEAASRSVAG
jgi:hypothetical protein